MAPLRGVTRRRCLPVFGVTPRYRPPTSSCNRRRHRGSSRLFAKNHYRRNVNMMSGPIPERSCRGSGSDLSTSAPGDRRRTPGSYGDLVVLMVTVQPGRSALNVGQHFASVSAATSFPSPPCGRMRSSPGGGSCRRQPPDCSSFIGRRYDSTEASSRCRDHRHHEPASRVSRMLVRVPIPTKMKPGKRDFDRARRARK